MKKVILLVAVLVAFLFCGPLFDRFKESIREASTEVRDEVYGRRLIGLFYHWLLNWSVYEDGDPEAWKDVDDSLVVDYAGKAALCGYIRRIKGGVADRLDFCYPGMYYRDDELYIQCAQFAVLYLDEEDSLNAVATRLWTQKRWGPAGTTWKKFVLRQLNRAGRSHK